MKTSPLTELFRQQAQRLHHDIQTLADTWQAGDASVLTPLRHAVHLLKGAALSASADDVALALHELEEGLQPGQSASCVTALSSLRQALQQWLARSEASGDIAELERTSYLPALDPLRRALRESFAAQAKHSQQAATLHLQLDPEVTLNPVLWDVLPQLLRNALVHGGEPGDVRRAAGKPERLQIWLRLRWRGERLSLIVADDGRGTARPQQAPDMMSGRGWGVAAVREIVASMPSGHLGFRCRAGTGSIVRIQWRPAQ